MKHLVPPNLIRFTATEYTCDRVRISISTLRLQLIAAGIREACRTVWVAGFFLPQAYRLATIGLAFAYRQATISLPPGYHFLTKALPKGLGKGSERVNEG